jgi:hypothetical protein
MVVVVVVVVNVAEVMVVEAVVVLVVVMMLVMVVVVVLVVVLVMVVVMVFIMIVVVVVVVVAMAVATATSTLAVSMTVHIPVYMLYCIQFCCAQFMRLTVDIYSKFCTLLKWKFEQFMSGEAWLHRFRVVILLQDMGHPWTSFARSVSIHTDPFLMISGLLTSYYIYKQLERTKQLDIRRGYVSKIMRYSTQFCVKYVSRLIR